MNGMIHDSDGDAMVVMISNVDDVDDAGDGVATAPRSAPDS